MLRKIKKCPICNRIDVKQSLYELITPNTVVVRRQKNKFGSEYTVIRGKNFEVLCGSCGESIFMVDIGGFTGQNG